MPIVEGLKHIVEIKQDPEFVFIFNVLRKHLDTGLNFDLLFLKLIYFKLGLIYSWQNKCRIDSSAKRRRFSAKLAHFLLKDMLKLLTGDGGNCFFTVWSVISIQRSVSACLGTSPDWLWVLRLFLKHTHEPTWPEAQPSQTSALLKIQASVARQRRGRVHGAGAADKCWFRVKNETWVRGCLLPLNRITDCATSSLHRDLTEKDVRAFSFTSGV